MRKVCSFCPKMEWKNSIFRLKNRKNARKGLFFRQYCGFFFQKICIFYLYCSIKIALFYFYPHQFPQENRKSQTPTPLYPKNFPTPIGRGGRVNPPPRPRVHVWPALQNTFRAITPRELNRFGPFLVIR